MPRHNRRPPGPTNQGGPAQPVRVAPGSVPYGERQQLEAAQQAAPLPAEDQRFQAALQGAQQMSRRGAGLRAGTGRPTEPLTAGMPTGPGPGPETTPQVQRVDGVPEDTETIRRVLPALEALANRPGSTAQARNLVRQLRGSYRPNYREET